VGCIVQLLMPQRQKGFLALKVLLEGAGVGAKAAP
jgi:hypothetical protein